MTGGNYWCVRSWSLPFSVLVRRGGKFCHLSSVRYYTFMRFVSRMHDGARRRLRATRAPFCLSQYSALSLL